MSVFRSLPDDYSKSVKKRVRATSVVNVRMSPYDAKEYRDLTQRMARLRACAAPIMRRITELRKRYGLHHWGAGRSNFSFSTGNGG